MNKLKPAFCKGCGAEINWIRTPAFKLCPIDFNSKNVWIQSDN